VIELPASSRTITTCTCAVLDGWTDEHDAGRHHRAIALERDARAMLAVMGTVPAIVQREAGVLARAGAAALAVALAAAPGPAAPAGRSLHWNLLDVEARLDAAGDLHVVERQVMVFSGDWNGGERIFRLERGQRLRLDRLLRVGADGVERPLSEGSLDAVDRYAWKDGRTLRWRSRTPRDPPFDRTEITYVLEYTVSGALVATGDGAYRLAHDFAFADRPGPIREVRVRLSLDPSWDSGASPLRLERRDLPPGQGAVLAVPLRFVGRGPAPGPGLLAASFPAPLRAPLLLAMAAALALAAAWVWRHGRARGFFDPIPDPGTIDEAWLREHVLAHPPEVIGAAWDGKVAGPEVSAVLARMAAEKKLDSSVERRFLGLQTVVRLRLLVDRAALQGYERRLVDGLFFDGDATDSQSLRRHYRSTGFDPASKISGEVRKLAGALVPRERRPRSPWLGAAALLVLAIVGGALAFRLGEEPFLLAAPAIAGLLLLLVSGIAAARFSVAVAGRIPRALAAIVPLVLWAAGIGWLAWGGAGAIFPAVVSEVLLWGAALVLSAGLARTPLVLEALAERRRLTEPGPREIRCDPRTPEPGPREIRCDPERSRCTSPAKSGARP
jgi:hypothetical protein